MGLCPKIITKESFELPDIGDTTTILVDGAICLSPNCWIWNKSVGYLEVIDYKDNLITVKNIGRIENAKGGSEFPSCMEFLIVAPDSLPLYDTTVTCLSADFISPEVGNTGIMVVQDTSDILQDDILIIDRQYRYTVVQVIDEHRLLVSNEGYGKEGIIKAECDKCVSVKILESTACCKVVREELQEEIDDINDRLNTKKSIVAWTGNNLVTVSGGSNALTDAQNNAIIKVDNDLSNYDNSNTKFITSSDIPTGNLTVSSTNNVLSINSGSGTGAFLKNANINLNLSNYAQLSDLPTVNNGTLTVKDFNGVTLGTFTANQSGPSNITVPAAQVIPTLPPQYSGFTSGANLMRSEYKISLNSGNGYVLKNEATSGSPTSDTQSLSSEFPTITIASPSLSGHNIIVFGTIFIMCEGEFHTDTHTYPDGSYHSLVTARGPSTEFKVKPLLNSSAWYSNDITSGREYHLALDKLGTTSADWQYLSRQVTVPIICEVSPNNTNTISFTSSFKAYGLRDAGGSSSNPDTFYNENVRVKINTLYIFIALGWVIK